ncbi:ATP-binding protein [Candidatus Bathyarchaeota archaeon]|nr:MAG: ATP-binding protein [Candidatus Bathyarchaeota archaeon]RLI30042.1 MAG: ATP-binding protein [Candidatus Bathyarchaeota archaeon]
MTDTDKLVLAVSGKGGVGKTTVTALITRLLSESGKYDVLVIDANPDSNLPDVLGIPVAKTVGDMATALRKSIEKGEIPLQVSKRELLESRVFEVLKETPDFDLLVMGRTEGEGCYCLVNSLLTHIIDTLSKNYDLTIMDMEAGLEHLSRRTSRDVDIMLIVTDLSFMGFQTARRIKELAKEVHIEFKKLYLIGNRYTKDKEGIVMKKAEEIGIEYGCIVPPDENVLRHNLEGIPLTKLPPDTPAIQAVKAFLTKIGLL